MERTTPGYPADMGSFDYTVTTAASPEQALAYLGDLTNLRHFVREVDSVESGGQGYLVTLDRGFLRSDMVVDYRVRTEAGAVVAEGTHKSIDAVDRWDVVPAGEGSEVRYHGTYELKGVAKATAPFAAAMGEWRAKGIGEDLERCLDQLAG